MDFTTLLEYAETDAQRRTIEAAIEHGSARAAATALGQHHSGVSRNIQRVRERAARLGHAPGHFDSGAAPGYLLGKVTVQRGADGSVERTWERQSPETKQWREVWDEAISAARESIEPVSATPIPISRNGDLCNLFIISDAHVGCLAWHREGGADWDLKIAIETLTKAFGHMIRNAPPADTAVVCFLGDLLHQDSNQAVTPAHGHLLDADSRPRKIVRAVVTLMRQMIGMALETHQSVHVISGEGNHDEYTSGCVLPEVLIPLYENEPRVEINDAVLPYYVYQHGNVMLGFHHGHKMKPSAMPSYFAAAHGKMWGDTTVRYAHCGHRHHVEIKEQPGMKVEQHSTLAARDAYAARGGWLSDRQAVAITYHREHGEIGRMTVVPGML